MCGVEGTICIFNVSISAPRPPEQLPFRTITGSRVEFAFTGQAPLQQDWKSGGRGCGSLNLTESPYVMTHEENWGAVSVPTSVYPWLGTRRSSCSLSAADIVYQVMASVLS